MQAIADVLAAADIQVTPVADARVPIWDKFVYLAAFSGFTGASRLAIGAHLEVPARAGDVLRRLARDRRDRQGRRRDDLAEPLRDAARSTWPTSRRRTRSSLLIDLEQGKRIEVEALQGAAVRRAAKHGVPVPIVSTLYALLKPWENGPDQVDQHHTGHGSTEARKHLFHDTLDPELPSTSTLKLISRPREGRVTVK